MALKLNPNPTQLSPTLFSQITMSPPQTPNNNNDHDDNEKSLLDLPKARFWESMDISQWEGYWFEPGLIKPAMTFRSTFTARDDDVLLASTMKTGTTWLKSLSLCILNNNKNPNLDILTTENPHFHVPTIESTLYSTKPLQIDIYDSSIPRLLHTHLPYAVLPDSIKTSGTKIVYIARNPKDTLISIWHFFNKILRRNEDPYPIEKAVDSFCSGVHQYGPFFEHVVEYWIESLKRPEKILFLKYEDLKSDPNLWVSRIGEFLGKKLEKMEDVDEILQRCDLERLKGLEVNKSGEILFNVPNSAYFRKGVVGDWRNYLTAEMEEMIDRTIQVKFEAVGLFF